jgi:hypothetical protein
MKERSTGILDVVTPGELAISEKILPRREQALLPLEIVADLKLECRLTEDDRLLGEPRPLLDAFSSDSQQGLFYGTGGGSRWSFDDLIHGKRVTSGDWLRLVYFFTTNL